MINIRHSPKMPANIETTITTELSVLGFFEIPGSSVKKIIQDSYYKYIP